MPRKAKAKSPEVKTTKPSKRGRKPKTVVSVTQETASRDLFAPVRQAFNNISLPNVNLKNVNRTYLYIGLGVLVLIALGVLAARYLVVAWVDNQPITKFALDNQLEKRYGSDMRDQMISEKLIDDEARNRGITVSQDEIDQQYQQYQDQFGGSDNMAAALQAQGIAPDDFKNQLHYQVLINKMFGDVTVSDDEVKQYIDQNQDQFKDATDEAKLQSDVRKQLQQQKTSQAFRDWLQNALKSTRVIHNG